MDGITMQPHLAGHAGVCEIILDRPEVLNAIDTAMATRLAQACAELASDSDSRVVVLSAAGDRAFSVGADLKERSRLSDAALLTTDLDEAQRLGAEADELLRATGTPIGIAHNAEGRGIVAYDRDELADAAAFVAEAVEVFARFGNLGCCAHALESAAVIVGQAGRPEVATELLGAADELRRSSGASHKPWEIRARHPDIEDRIAPLAPAVHEAALTKGRRHTLESAARAALDALSTISAAPR
jgi:hypothetical protein